MKSYGYEWTNTYGLTADDLRIDDSLSGLHVGAGGAPEYVVLIAPDWFDFFVRAARGE